jgi:hypothetical protein
VRSFCPSAATRGRRSKRELELIGVVVGIGDYADKARDRVVSTQRWRLETIPTPVICRACCNDCTSHFMHPVGLDKLGRPVIYSVFNMVRRAGLGPGANQPRLFGLSTGRHSFTR